MINLMQAMHHFMGKTLSIDKCPVGAVLSVEIQQNLNGFDTIQIQCILDRANFDKMAEYAEVQEFFEGARLKKQWEADHKPKRK